MKKIFIIAVITALIAASGCTKASVPIISETSKATESSKSSVVSSVVSTASLPTNEVSLSKQYIFEVNVMKTTDWQSFEDTDSGTKSFSLSFPENWVRDAEGASTLHNKENGIKVFESVTAVKLAAGFDFAGSFLKKNFEDSMADTSVIGDIKIEKLTLASGEKTYATVIQSVVPEGGGEIQIDRWYPYFCVINDGNYAYCFEFYSLNDPSSDDKDHALFMDIMQTFKAVS